MNYNSCRDAFEDSMLCVLRTIYSSSYSYILKIRGSVQKK